MGTNVATGICGLTLGLLIFIPRVVKRVPAPLLALAAAAVIAVLLDHLVTDFHVATIGSKFQVEIDGETVRGIPPLPPMPVWPWDLGGANGSEFVLSFALIRELMPAAFAIAMLGAIESLMSAVIADGMAGTKHDPNSELIALGIANMVCPFFGGIAASGAAARTAANLRTGARSPLAAALQSVIILAGVIVLAPLMAYLPLAALAAMMLVLARNQSEILHFLRLARIGQRSDVLVMFTCFVLTVAFDMVLAVTVGVVLAALLFMRRMAVLTKVVLDTRSTETYSLPPGVRLYEVAGPLFFGAAKSAMDALHNSDHTARLLILSMKHVPTIDATGLVAVESVLERLQRSKTHVILAGLQAEVAELLERAGIRRVPGRLSIAPDVETAVSMAIVHAAHSGS
jgi:SulP family sulfate permease